MATERSALLGGTSPSARDLEDNAAPSWLRRSVSKSFGRVGRRTRVTVSLIAMLAVAVGGVALVTVIVLRYTNAAAAAAGEFPAEAHISNPANADGLTPFDVPFYWTNVANTPSLHWNYPDVNVAKALGGCGIHNAMLYVRALPSDLHRWSMSKWTWKKALELYTRMEDFDGPRSDFHGHAGIVRTSPPSLADPLSSAFVDTCEEIGIPRTNDFNAPNGRHGVGFYHFNTRDGVRESAARRFIGPMLKEGRTNFHLLLNTEVISGLGHKGDLVQLGLPVVKHLPRVGMNLQDHPVVAISFENPQPVPVDLNSELAAYFAATTRRDPNATSYGMMGSAGISAGAFLIPPGSTLPEIQLTLFPRKSEPHVSNSSELNHAPQILVTVALLHPRARNRVVLEKSDAGQFIPRIVSEVPEQEAEHLREDDVWKLSWGVAVVREVAAAMARKGLFGAEITPGPSVSTMNDLIKWIPSAVFRNSHWVGSAAMGQSADTAVVDNHLRVFGLTNVRVADASIIPSIPNGNVHSSVLMVASHGAELIRADDE
ncbi:hypothetical protein P43SY_004419 [Pythium insidiosum]|uniref:Choline dehydrogenase n=1 Tax=Pythium insidiosum TaxID=114742 RepID=A0AAD5QEE6_PYTIN|nr:hypothetical protein P43SY_004419 [Pythium insidiosum]